MKSSLFFLIFIFSFYCADSQTSINDPKDVEGWYSSILKFNMPKKWEPYFQYEARFNNNLKTYYGSYISIGTSKKITKKTDLLSEYRVSLFKTATYHRFTLGAQTEKKLNKKTDLSFRLLFQNRIEDYLQSDETSQQSLWWRIRAGIKYQISKNVDAYASVEPVMEFGGEEPVNNWRNTIGIKYKIYKKTKLDLYYIYNPDYGKKTYNRTFNIIGVNVTHTLNAQQKNKKKK